MSASPAGMQQPAQAASVAKISSAAAQPAAGTPLGRLVAALDTYGCHPWAGKARCPAHKDNTPSLSYTEGRDGRVLVRCHAGCTYSAIAAALGLSVRDLFAADNGNGKRREVAAYDYRDEAGELLFQVVRFIPKDFRQRRPDGQGGWTWKLGTTRRVLYRLPAVIEAVKAGRTVYVVEGEKDVATLVAWKLAATCNPGGAGKWRPEYSETLRGARVVIIPDADRAGREHAAQVAKALADIAAEVKIIDVPAKDVSAWAQQGGTCEQFEALIEKLRKAAVQGIVTVTAAELKGLTFEPAATIVGGLLLAGLFLLAGPPKIGKSWLAVLFALAKAMGGEALSVRTTASPVLFVGLEDPMRRLQSRLRMILSNDEPWPANLHLADSRSWPWRGTEAVDKLRRWHDTHPGLELVVLDTLGRLRPPVGGKRASGYDLDVEFVAPFQQFAIERNLSVLGNVHTRKQDRRYRELDGIEAVSGTLGLPGTADGVLVLQRGRLARQGELLITGRDLPERKLALTFEPSRGLWSCLGNAEDVAASQGRQAALDAMREAGEEMTLKQIAEASGAKYENTKKLMQRLVGEGRVLKVGAGSYSLPPVDTTSPVSLASPVSAVSPISPEERETGIRGHCVPEQCPREEARCEQARQGYGDIGDVGDIEPPNRSREPGDDDETLPGDDNGGLNL